MLILDGPHKDKIGELIIKKAAYWAVKLENSQECTVIHERYVARCIFKVIHAHLLDVPLKVDPAPVPLMSKVVVSVQLDPSSTDRARGIVRDKIVRKHQ